ncbi:MAG: NAD(P)/FAD-dependent oxidoreductase [Solirubrobacteraceae bacterium]
MTRPGPIVIVGAGAAGLSTALQLAERGCRDVTVIDRAHVAAGSSGVSVGIYTRQYTDPLDIRLRVECYERLCALEREAGLTLIRNGFLRLAHDEASLEIFEEGARRQHELGVPDARALDRDELKRLVPDMRCDDLAGGLFGPSDGYLDGQQLCMTYAERAEALGVRVLARRALVGYEEGGARRHRLFTTGETLECDVVINAAGAWAPAVGDILGAPVEIVAERHQACIMHFSEPLPYRLPSVMDYVPGSGRLGLYFRPEGERQLIVGLHSNDRLEEGADPDAFHRGADAAFMEELIPMLIDRMPRFDGVGLQDGWAGLYPNSSDERFIIGPMPGREGVFAACGLDGVGVYTSPAVGRMAADWVLDGAPAALEEAERFAPYRLTVKR